VFNIINISFTR